MSKSNCNYKIGGIETNRILTFESIEEIKPWVRASPYFRLQWDEGGSFQAAPSVM